MKKPNKRINEDKPKTADVVAKPYGKSQVSLNRVTPDVVFKKGRD